MFHCKLGLMLLVILIYQRMNSVSALTVERIIGGEDANITHFKYHVAILGKSNNTDMYKTVCGGGTISPFLVLSAAHCFLEDDGTLKNMSFSIGAGSDNLNSSTSVKIEVDLIFITRIDVTFTESDLAVLKSKYQIVNGSNVNVAALMLPESNDAAENDMGTVTGFGYNWIKFKILANGAEIIDDGGSDMKLRYGLVRVVNIRLCLNWHISAETHICGSMIPSSPERITGPCFGDSGGPFVIDNKVVGILSRSTTRCDDTIVGCVYTRVSYYVDFIKAIIDGTPLPGTVVFHNPPYAMKSEDESVKSTPPLDGV